MEDSGAILCQISLLKDMLDQLNEEIEANYEITREIESEIVKCCEFESAMAVRESKLTKSLYLLHFEIHGLRTVTADSRASAKCLEEEISSLGVKRDEILNSVNNKREMFTSLCLNFQKSIDKGEDFELESLLSEKEHLENEVQLWTQKNNSLQNSVSAFLEDVLEDLRNSNSALHLEIESGKLENKKVLKDIDELKATLLSTISM